MKFKLLVLVTALALCFGVATGWAQNPTFIRGDVTADGVVNGDDITMLTNYLFSMTPMTCQLAGDFNDDGVITSPDLMQLTSFVNSGGAAPPPPYPDCGEDPTNPQAGTSCCEIPQEPTPVRFPSTTTAGLIILLILLAMTSVWILHQRRVASKVR